MNILHVEKFKANADTLLLGCSRKEILQLRMKLLKFSKSSTNAEVVCSDSSTQNSNSLWAVSTVAGHNKQQEREFGWLCGFSEIEEIDSSLSSLEAKAKGHQYFDLVESDTILIVSVGEYDENFWVANG